MKKIDKRYISKLTDSYVKVILCKDRVGYECHIEMYKNVGALKRDDFWYARHVEGSRYRPRPDFTTYGFGNSYKEARQEAYQAVLADWPNNPK